MEVVLDGDGQAVVVIELERLHAEVRGQHGAVQSCSSGNDFERVQSTLQLCLFEEHLCLVDENWSPGRVTNQLDRIYVIWVDLYGTKTK